MILISEAWKNAYPGARAGFLIMDEVANPEQNPELDRLKGELEEQLRLRYSGYTREELRALPSILPYQEYYSRFKKTYHVLLQLESVALKGKRLPGVAALVEAMFMAELKNQLLTAGHDYKAIRGAVKVDVASGSELYTLLNEQEQELKPGDMFMADGSGVISSVLYGPDARTRIHTDTRQALFAVYAPPGIEEAIVTRHLEDIHDLVLVIAPQAVVQLMKVYGSE